jgi:hypothetical protein
MPFHFRSESISNLKRKTNKTLNCERTRGNCGGAAMPFKTSNVMNSQMVKFCTTFLDKAKATIGK